MHDVMCMVCLTCSTDPEQDSVDFVAVIKYSTAEVGDCIQVGKYNFLGGSGERCTNYYDWPADWNSGVTSGTSFSASVDVSGAAYTWPDGEYTVREVNEVQPRYL
jgi:hypothetical protein